MRKYLFANGILAVKPFVDAKNNNKWKFKVDIKRGETVRRIAVYCHEKVKTYIEDVEVGEEIGLVLIVDSDFKNEYYAAFAAPKKIKHYA